MSADHAIDHLGVPGDLALPRHEPMIDAAPDQFLLQIEPTVDGRLRILAAAPSGMVDLIQPLPAIANPPATEAEADEIWKWGRSAGIALFRTIFPPAVHQLLDESRHRRSQVPLPIALQIEDPEVARLPWELLRDPDTDRLLALSEASPFSRRLTGAAHHTPVLTGDPLQILIIAPEGDPRAARLAQSLAKKDVIEVTVASTRQRTGHRTHVVHVLGTMPLDLMPAETALAIIEGGAQTATNALARSPAVVALPPELEPAAQTAFLGALYAHLGAGEAIDQAVQMGRRAVSLGFGLATLAWAKPILLTTQLAGPVLVPDRRLDELGHRVKKETVDWFRDTLSGLVSSVVVFLLGLILFRLGFSPSAELSTDVLSPLSLYESFKGLVVELSTYQEQILLAGAGALLILATASASIRWVVGQSNAMRRLSAPTRRVLGLVVGRRTVTFLAVGTLLVLAAYGYQQYLWQIALPIPQGAFGLAVTREAAAASLREDLALALATEGSTRQMVIRELPIAFDATDIDAARALGRRIGAEAVLIYSEEQLADDDNRGAFVAYVVFTDPSIGLVVGSRGQSPRGEPTTQAEPAIQVADGVAAPALRARTVKELVDGAVGIIAYHQGQYREAITHLELANPNRSEEASFGLINYYLGLAYDTDGQSESSARALEQAIAFYTSRGPAGTPLGNQDKLILAKSLLARARIALFANDPSGTIAWSERALGLRDELLARSEGLARPIEVHGTFARLYAQMAVAYRLRENPEEERRWSARAIAELDEVSRQADSDHLEAWLHEATGRFYLGDCVAAERAINRALVADPTYVAAHVSAAVLAMQADRLDDAVAHLNQAIALEPGETQARQVLASILIVQAIGDGYFEPAYLDQAERIDREILSIDQGNPRAHDDLALIASLRANAELHDYSALLAGDTDIVAKSREAWSADPSRLAAALESADSAIDQYLVLGVELRPNDPGTLLELTRAYHARQEIRYWQLPDLASGLDHVQIVAIGVRGAADGREAVIWADRLLSNPDQASRYQRLEAWNLANDARNDEWGWYAIFAPSVASWFAGPIIDTQADMVEFEWRAATDFALAEVAAARPADRFEAASMSGIYSSASLFEAFFGDPTRAGTYRTQFLALATSSEDVSILRYADQPFCEFQRERVEGDRLRVLGEWAGARLHYEAALAFNPTHVPTLLALADVLETQGDLSGAIARAQLAAETTPVEPAPWALLGRLRLMRGEEAASDLAYQRFFSLVRGLPPQQRMAGLRNAILSLQSLVEAQPANRGAVRRLLPRLSEAVDGVAGVSNGTYQYPKLLALLGRLALTVDDPTAAERLLRASTALDPFQPVAQTDLALATLQLGMATPALLDRAVAAARSSIWIDSLAGDPSAQLAAIGRELRWYGELFPDRALALAPLNEQHALARERFANHGVAGASYVAPVTGLRLDWNDAWSVSEATSGEGVDGLRLVSRRGELLISAARHRGREVEACLTDVVDADRANPGWHEFAAAVDPNGVPIAGGDLRRAFGLYTYQVDAGTLGLLPWAAYFECRVVEPGPIEVVILFTTPMDALMGAAPEVEQVLATLRPELTTNGGPSPIGTTPLPRLDPTRVAGALPGVDGLSYVGPMSGTSLRWHDDWWVLTSTSAATADTLLLTNGLSFVQVSSGWENGDTPTGCLRAVSDELRANPTLLEVQLAQDEQGRPRRGGAGAEAWMIFAYRISPAEGDPWEEMLYVSCRALANGSILRIEQVAPAADFKTEAAARDILLRNLSAPKTVERQLPPGLVDKSQEARAA